MKKLVKLLLILTLTALCTVVLSVSVYAVPAYNGGEANPVSCKSHTNKLVTLDDIPSAKVQDGKKAVPSAIEQKEIPLLVIVIGFDNISYNDNYNWNEEIFSGERSLQKYYSDMSFGQFTFVPVRELSRQNANGNTNKYDKSNDGIVHIKLDSSHDNWSLQQASAILDWNYNYTLTKTFISAIKQANAFVNFSQYDVNKNGLIENNEMALGFVVAGNEAAFEEYGNYNTFSFWSHAWSISDAISGYNFNLSVPVVDGVKVDSYIGIAENLEKGVQEPICILAHELGHYLGLPDLYDTDYSTTNTWSDYTVGEASVMCSGTWCYDEENESFTPSSLDAWSRYVLGWITPAKHNSISNTVYTLTGQDYDDYSKRISTLIITTQNSNEYYLLENRQFVKWDKYLGSEYEGADGGIILWHIDNNVYNDNEELNTVNNTDHRPAVMPLFPESSNSKTTFIGAGEVTLNPFFDSVTWNENCSNLGNKLNLPIYGKGKNADKRTGRTLSGISVQFLSQSSPSMSINVDSTGHVHTKVHLNSQPSCLIKGYVDCWFCSYCRKYFTDENCTMEIPASEAIIPPVGHDFVFSKTVKPMADEDGHDLYVCSRCSTTKKENFKKLVGWGQDKNGIWYYATTDGVFLTGWKNLKNKWYFFNSDGQMQTGWVKSKGKWYYMSSSGAMKTNGWVKDDGKYYYVDANGVMQTGWIKYNNKWYYLSSGGVMQKGWKKIDNNWYYFNTSGDMRTENLTYKGKVYKFKSNGICINP